MARISNGALSGAIGNLVFYTVNGITYVRSKPAPKSPKQRQPPSAINTGFGTISRYGSQMLQALAGHILYKPNRSNYNHVRGWMLKQYHHNSQALDWPLTPYASGVCNVNQLVDMRDCLLVNIGLSNHPNGKLTMNLPAMNPAKQINAPAHTGTVILKAIAVGCSFNARAATGCTVAVGQHSMAYTNALLPPAQLLLHTGFEKGTMAIVALALEYITTNRNSIAPLMDAAWLPVAIVAMGRC